MNKREQIKKHLNIKQYIVLGLGGSLVSILLITLTIIGYNIEDKLLFYLFFIPTCGWLIIYGIVIGFIRTLDKIGFEEVEE